MKNEFSMNGMFGIYGGRFVSEILMPAILELEKFYEKSIQEKNFKKMFSEFSHEYSGRPSNLYYAKNLSDFLGGCKIYLKREDLNHTGSHKINNCLGQILLAKNMGKKRVIAETGAGQHGVATATVAAYFKIPCVIYMGSKDIKRQKSNVLRMKLLGAEIKSVSSGNGTLKDAINEVLRDWVSDIENTYYLIGTAAGPHPYPKIVRNFQSIIGEEVRDQILIRENRFPDLLIASVGGGSNAIGLFYSFLDNKEVNMVGVEAGGLGLHTKEHCASLTQGTPGVLHGNRTYLLQDIHGQIQDGYSISAGLDYPGVGPEHAWLKDINRVEYVSITDHEALNAFQILIKTEGIIPALESSHAIAEAMKRAKILEKEKIIVVNLSGRGDKDIQTVCDIMKINP